MLPSAGANGQADLSVPRSTLCSLVPSRDGWHHRRVLRELRGTDGEPHAGTRLVALVLALLLAAPLTFAVWLAARAALGLVL